MCTEIIPSKVKGLVQVRWSVATKVWLATDHDTGSVVACSAKKATLLTALVEHGLRLKKEGKAFQLNIYLKDGTLQRIWINTSAFKHTRSKRGKKIALRSTPYRLNEEECVIRLDEEMTKDE